MTDEILGAVGPVGHDTNGMEPAGETAPPPGELTEEQLEAFTTSQIAALTTTQIVALSTTAIAGLTAENIGTMSTAGALTINGTGILISGNTLTVTGATTVNGELRLTAGGKTFTGLVTILNDLFHDHEVSGWGKAAWVVFLIFIPFLTGLVYLITRGEGMRERAIKRQADTRKQFDSYVRETAGTSPVDELTKLSALKEKGDITDADYEKMKAKLVS